MRSRKRRSTNPLGGINSVWPLFGISSRFLAAVALCVGTTILITSAKVRFVWTTLVPLAFMAVAVLVVVVSVREWLLVLRHRSQPSRVRCRLCRAGRWRGIEPG